MGSLQVFELNIKYPLFVLTAVREKSSIYVSIADCACSQKICFEDKLSSTVDWKIQGKLLSCSLSHR